LTPIIAKPAMSATDELHREQARLNKGSARLLAK
jgi:hypothetical protein